MDFLKYRCYSPPSLFLPVSAWDRVSLCSPNWPQTSASVSQILELQVWFTMVTNNLTSLLSGVLGSLRKRWRIQIGKWGFPWNSKILVSKFLSQRIVLNSCQSTFQFYKNWVRPRDLNQKQKHLRCLHYRMQNSDRRENALTAPVYSRICTASSDQSPLAGHCPHRRTKIIS